MAGSSGSGKQCGRRLQVDAGRDPSAAPGAAAAEAPGSAVARGGAGWRPEGCCCSSRGGAGGSHGSAGTSNPAAARTTALFLLLTGHILQYTPSMRYPRRRAFSAHSRPFTGSAWQPYPSISICPRSACAFCSTAGSGGSSGQGQLAAPLAQHCKNTGCRDQRRECGQARGRPARGARCLPRCMQACLQAASAAAAPRHAPRPRAAPPSPFRGTTAAARRRPPPPAWLAAAADRQPA